MQPQIQVQNITKDELLLLSGMICIALIARIIYVGTHNFIYGFESTSGPERERLEMLKRQHDDAPIPSSFFVP